MALRITGPAGGTWLAHRADDEWQLTASSGRLDTVITMDEDTAWRGFTRGIDFDHIPARTRVDGDPGLGEAIMRMVSIIA